MIIEVSDTGHGIPEEIQSKVFEPFYTTKSENEGTGLGLSSVKGWVEEMDGEIALSSKVGEGTTFYIVFPVSNQSE